MSTDLSAATGAKFPITLGGKTYLATPVKVSMWGEIHNHLISKRLNVLEQTAATIASFPPALQQQALQAAMAQAASPAVIPKETLGAYMESWEGTIHLLWMMLRPDAPELTTPDKLLPLVGELSLPVLSKMVAVAGGLEASKNSPGPTENPPAP